MTSAQRVVHDPLHAFCTDTEAYLEGAPDRPLSGLSFAAKDIFDVAGYVTGGGNPDWKRTHEAATRTAWAVQVLVEAGATMVGKTITDELTRGIFGENAHEGTPVNPHASDRVPGGSSSGSAAAVAGGLVAFALGSDTGGSVRVPASFCGLYGLRPTHGRIPLDGVLLQAPSYDTVGWFARDIDTFARVGAVLLQSPIAGGRPRRVMIAADAFEVAEPAVQEALWPIVDRVLALVGRNTTERVSLTSLRNWSSQQQVLQGREAWETAREWIDRVNPRLSFEVAERYTAARAITDDQVAEAKNIGDGIRARMAAVLADDAVICLPTTPTPAPLRGEALSVRALLRLRLGMLTCIAGTSGLPQLTLPLAAVDGLPVGLSIIGSHGTDERLIAFARDIATVVGR
jgi:amidase